MAGEGLLKIGRLVGHKNQANTNRYTHLDNTAAAETGAILQEFFFYIKVLSLTIQIRFSLFS